MTKVRRIAQLVEDLETLGVITAEQVRTLPGLDEKQIMIMVEVPEHDFNNRILIKEAFEEEFSEDVTIIKDPNVFQAVI